MKSLQKEQNSTNLLLWPPICRNKSAIPPKWFNSLDTNSMHVAFTLSNFAPFSIFQWNHNKDRCDLKKKTKKKQFLRPRCKIAVKNTWNLGILFLHVNDPEGDYHGDRSWGDFLTKFALLDKYEQSFRGLKSMQVNLSKLVIGC